MKIILTGIAGFIGFHLAKRLLTEGVEIVGIDNLNPYYNPQLKLDRLEELKKVGSYTFIHADISDEKRMKEVFADHAEATHVVHLAAQAGVRYSLTNPMAYVTANVAGQVSIIEAARTLKKPQHVVYASSSSVYGANTKMPFSVSDRTDSPISLYAATKKSCELLAESYARLYELPLTGLRFFTVYGPWGRPDMAAYLFADAITNAKPLKVFNQGNMERDFTYVEDIVSGIIKALKNPPLGLAVPHRVFNLGNHQPVKLMDFISTLADCLGKEPQFEMQPMQLGDVARTWADIDETRRVLGWEPTTPVTEGLPKFVDWYQKYHRSH